MTSSIQGIIIALLIAFLVGILVCYSLMQGRMRRQAKALKISQRRLEEIEQSHELRLRETTTQLRQEYEAELAETIEHYQDQLSQKAIEMEQVYETRFRVLQQGEISPPPPPPEPQRVVHTDPIVKISPTPVPRRGEIEPLPDDRDRALTHPQILHFKKQYEARLKEAVQKLQSAYEKQLAAHAKAVREDIKKEYEIRLSAKSKAYEQQLAEETARLEEEYRNRPAPASLSDLITEEPDITTPSSIMGTGDETTMTMPPAKLSGAASEDTTANYTQDEMEARIQEAIAGVREEYEQRLSDQLDERQDQFQRQMQTMEADYQQRIQDLSAANPGDEMNPTANEDDDFGPLDLSDIGDQRR
ncbi:hypothetical protein PN498_20210 [Oscillatoria sp. CS-180]|uniref:LapA family protein n=1 Tax=Oscillatoria sp. CS-180 TaxID=3021720 RepID=UPI0023303AE3|nr:hypothetical protein [Oscillatoria sp. CS-180]MDB9528327.1 hypothetical protein [Oscillatoria sp. CS-180]